jgi:tryptophan 2,3-dioxygenase
MSGKGSDSSNPPVGCPYHIPTGVSAETGAAGEKPGNPNVYGQSDLTYNDYLKVSDLLNLQVPQSEPEHHDELLFIVIHQAYELWFKLILHEMQTSIQYMREKNVLRAHHFMKRICEIMKLLVQQIHILETMTPAEFLQFRDRLMPASGFQSIQYREIEFLAGLKDESYLAHFKNRPEFLKILKDRMVQPDLKSAYYELLHELGETLGDRRGSIDQAGAHKPSRMPKDAAALEYRIKFDAQYVSKADPKDIEAARMSIMNAILPIYQHQERHLALYLLSESLVEFDEYFSLWREHHVRVVERVIGFKQGTGGSSGVGYLRSTTTKKIFPLLWEVRTYLEKY